MGGAASTARGNSKQRGPVTKEDRAQLQQILETCAYHAKVYCESVQGAANFKVDFQRNDGTNSGSPNPDHHHHRHQARSLSASEHEGFANSKGTVPQADVGRNTGLSQTQKRAKQFAELMRWLEHHGAFKPNVSICESGEAGFAVHCTAHIKESRVVMKIPLQCLITDTVASQTPTGRILVGLHDRLAALAHCQLSVFLLEDMEKGQKSPFHAYYQSLPRDLPQHSLFWTQQEQECLQGSCFINDVHSFKNMVRADYATIVDRIPSFSRFSFQRFLWSRIVVSSRNFSIRVNKSDHIALVPLADMMNHHEPRRTAWEYRDGDQAFVITSLDSFRAGTQITNSYGQKSASQLLLHYGFIPENFGQNRVELIENQITIDLCPSQIVPARSFATLDQSNASFPPRKKTPYRTKRTRASGLLSFGDFGSDGGTTPQHVSLKKRIVGEAHVFRLRINFSHGETASCLRYLAVLATQTKSHLLQIKRMEKMDEHESLAPIFFDLKHLASACSIVSEQASRRIQLLKANFPTLANIKSYNNLNAWRIAQIESAVAQFFQALADVMLLIETLHTALIDELLAHILKRKNLMSQWVHHLFSCCIPMINKLDQAVKNGKRGVVF